MATDTDNYVKTHEGVNLVCLKAAPHVETVVQTWHKDQKTTAGLPPCNNPSVCPKKGKPTQPKGSCRGCISWGAAIETVYYPPSAKGGIAWQNVNPTLLHNNPIEVAKAFVLRLPYGANPQTFTDFDSASLLKIMMGFGDFHGNTKANYDIIQKVSDIRNKLSHMKPEERFYIPDDVMLKHFSEMDELVTFMQNVHFNAAEVDDIRSELNKIASHPVTIDMEERALQALTAAVRQVVKPDLYALSSNMSQVPQRVSESIQPGLQTLSKDLSQVPQRVSESIQPGLQTLSKDMNQVPQRVSESIQPGLQTLSKDMSQVSQSVIHCIQPGIQALSNNMNQVPQRVSESIQPELQALSKDMSEIQQRVSRSIQPELQALSKDMSQVSESVIQSIQPELQALAQTRADDRYPEPEVLQEKIHQFGKLLKAKYLREKREIRFGKSRHAIADTEYIYVDLKLLEDEKPGSGDQQFQSNSEYGYDVNPQGKNRKYIKGRKLESYQELITLFDKDGRQADHILMRGNAGCGKTTLLSRIAYQWAKAFQNNGDLLPGSKEPYHDTSVPVLSSMKLVLLLDIRKFKAKQTLQEAIEKQLLPGVSKDIEDALGTLGTECLILLDGFDEMVKGITDHALDSQSLSQCFVIVTTRPHKVDEFCINQKGYVHVQISGFSRKKSFLYVERFFSNAKVPNRAHTLIKKIKETPVLEHLSTFPILLVMMCLLFKDADAERENVLFHSISKLYKEAMKYLNKPFERKLSSKVVRSIIDDVVLMLGEPALRGVLANNLQLSEMEFDDDELLEKSFEIGLTYKEEGDLIDDASVVFIHKTFQEYSAAVYLTRLFDSNREKFDSYLERISKYNVKEMEYLLRFCCGLNINAAEVIVPYVVLLMNQSHHRQPWRLPLILLLETSLSHADNWNRILKLQSCLVSLENCSKVYVADAEIATALSHCSSKSNTQGEQEWFSKIKSLDWNFSTGISTMIQILHNMSSLENMSYGGMHLLDENTLHVQKCRTSVKSLFMSCVTSANTMMKLLGCMPLVETINFYGVEMTGELDEKIFVSCASVKELQIGSSNGRRCSLSADTMLRLLKCMPSVTAVKLDIMLTDEESSLRVSCEASKEIHVGRVDYHDYGVSTLSANTLLRLLHCMPPVAAVRLNDVTLVGEVDDNILVSYVSVKELQVGRKHYSTCKLSANTMLRLLGCMPCLTEVNLNVALTGETLMEASSSHQSIKGLQIDTLSANTMLKHLTRMPPVKIVNLTNEVDINISVCESIKELQKKGSKCTLSTHTMLRILSCMPSLTTAKLDGMNLSTLTEDDDNILVSSGEIRDNSVFGLKYTLCPNTILRLLHGMPSVTKVKFCNIELSGEVNERFLFSGESIRDFEIGPGKCTLNANTLLQILGCMPSVTTVTLSGVELTDEVDDTISVTCEEVKELLMGFRHIAGLCTLRANTMVKILDCMVSSKTTVELHGVKLIGELNTSMIMSSESKQLRLKKISYDKPGILSANTMLKLLGCLPSVTTVDIDGIELIGDIDENLIVSCESIKELSMGSTFCTHYEACKLSDQIMLSFMQNRRPSSTPLCRSRKELPIGRTCYNAPCTLTATTMLRLLSCMPSVTKVNLDGVKLTGEVDSKPLPKCYSMKELQLGIIRYVACTLSANTMLRLLDCMPSVSTVKLDGVELTGDVNDGTSVSCKSVKKLQMSGTRHDALCTLNANTMMRLLGCMPSLTIVEFNGVKLLGEVADSIHVLCKSIKELQVGSKHFQACTLSENTMMRLLNIMPSVTTATFDRINLIAEDDTIHVPRESITDSQMRKHYDAETIANKMFTLIREEHACLKSTFLDKGGFIVSCELGKELQMGSTHYNACKLQASTMLRLLGCMPSVTIVQLNGDKLLGDVAEGILVSCNSIKELHLRSTSDDTCKPIASTILRVWNCMPSLRTAILDGVTLEGELDDGESVSCESIKELRMQTCILKANTMVILLGCLPSVTKVQLKRVQLGCELGNISVSCALSKELNIYNSGTPPCKLSANMMLRLLNCMPSIKAVNMGAVELTNSADNNQLLVPCESIKKLQVVGNPSTFTLSTNALLRTLGCMPSLRTLKLCRVNLAGDIDDNFLVSCASINELQMGKSEQEDPCTLSANTMFSLLGCMTSATIVKLYNVKLAGDVDDDKLLSGNSIKKLYMGSMRNYQCVGSSMLGDQCVMSANTMLRLLSCMPPKAKVRVDGVKLIGEIGDIVLVPCKSIKNINIHSIHIGVCELSENTLLRLLGCMPSVKVKLDNVDLNDEVDVNFAVPELVSCECIKELHLGGTRYDACTLSANTMLRLLDCMPFLTVVKLDSVELTGEVDDSLTVSCTAIKEFQMGDRRSGCYETCTLSANTMFKLLQCMPSVTTAELYGVKLTDKSDDSILVTCSKRIKAKRFGTLNANSFLEFGPPTERVKAESAIKLRINKMIKVMRCMPTVTNVDVCIDGLKLTGEVNDETMVSCKSIRKLQIGVGIYRNPCQLSANTMLKLLACMPLVRTVSLGFVHITDELDERLLRPCRSIMELEIGISYHNACTLSATSMLKLLACLPSVTTVKLNSVNLTGRVDDDQLYFVLSKSIKELEMGSIRYHVCTPCANTMTRLIKCLSSATTLKLNHLALPLTIDELDESIELCDPIDKLHMESICYNAREPSTNRIMRLLDGMTSLATVIITGIKITGEVEKSKCMSCESIKELQIGASCTLSANAMVRLLCCMSSLTKVTLDSVQLIGKVDDNTIALNTETSISLPCLGEVSLSACSFLSQVLVFWISSQTNLKSLMWVKHQSKLTEDDVRQVFTAVPLKIQVLQLDHTTLINNTDDLNPSFAMFLKEHLPYLQELNLSNAQLGETHCAELFTLICEAGRSFNEEPNRVTVHSTSQLPLQWLDISGNKIGNAVNEFAQVFQCMLGLRGLVLSNCGMKHILISKGLPTSTSKPISRNKDINSKPSPSASNLLKSELNRTTLTDRTGSKFSLEKLSNLTELNLSKNEIDCEGAKILSKSFSKGHTPALQHINLAENNIGSDGASALARSFQCLSLLKKLDLSCNELIGPKGIENMFRNLIYLPRLEWLGLAGIELNKNSFCRFPLLRECLSKVKCKVIYYDYDYTSDDASEESTDSFGDSEDNFEKDSEYESEEKCAYETVDSRNDTKDSEYDSEASGDDTEVYEDISIDSEYDSADSEDDSDESECSLELVHNICRFCDALDAFDIRSVCEIIRIFQ